ncbi:MAG TPA: GAF and ANTAR domain-containing protein [Desulfatiglandales bacterium]|nr:GAF and ANTAR domain-containing protein [Desulfatiglandales bacterium]
MNKISAETYDKYIKAITEISNAITSDQYLEDILKLIVMVTARVTGVEICSLWLIEDDGKGKKARLKATQAIDPDYVKDRVLDLDKQEGVVGFIALTNRPLAVLDVLKEPRFKEKDMAKKLGLVSMLGVPLHVKENKVIGVLDCFTTETHSFSETEISLITAVANQAAIAIENTQLMVRTKIIEEELEKRKMIDRAKEILMEKKGFSGEKAFRWIQKKSMDTRKSMKQIAEAVIISQDI